MAQKKNQGTNNEKQNDGHRKDKGNGGAVKVVLKLDLHCQGCAGKIVKAVCSFDGVESAKVGDIESNKITVIGEVDPDELRRKVERKIKKKVELVSPAKKKVKFDENNNQLIAAVKDEIKPDKFPVTTTVFKLSLHCKGCIEKIQRLVRKTKGFVKMSIDERNDLVIVNGGMDVNELKEVLKDKLKREVEIVPVKEEGNKKKGKGGDGDAEGAESGGSGRRVEENKMENIYVRPPQYMYPQYVNGQDYTFHYMHAPQIFNDENPNACALM